MIKIVLYSVLGFIGIIALAFALNIGGLHWKMFFGPKYANVERKIFEESKSYTHGKIEDLGKYFQEYQEAKTQEDKDIIKEFVRLRFNEFDANKINNYKLKQFLISMRGY